MMSIAKHAQKPFLIPSSVVPTKSSSVNTPTPFHPLLHLQRTMGNQVVDRLIQSKLKVSRPGDPYEREADRVADHVMRMAVPTTVWGQNRAPLIQRVCEDCEDEVLRQQDEDDEEELLLGKAAQDHPLEIAPNLGFQIQNLSGGQPLPESVRSFFEPRFGQDFGGVQVHIDSHASDMARAVNARAFTRGNSIVFGGGEYAPGTNEGKRLLAHELAHVVQQGAAPARQIPGRLAWGSQVRAEGRGTASSSVVSRLQSGLDTLQLQKGPVGKASPIEKEPPGKSGPKEAWVPCVMPGKRAGLPAAFLQKLDNICGRMSAEGYPTRIFWGLRTLAQQVEIATRGRTFPEFKDFVLNQAKKGHVTAKEAQQWIDHYDPKVGKNPLTSGFKSPVTWTLRSRHRSAKAADVAHPKKGWNVDADYKKALKAAAQAEGLQIGPPASDWAHVEVP